MVRNVYTVYLCHTQDIFCGLVRLLIIYLTISLQCCFFVNSEESAVDGDQLHAWNEWIKNGNKYFALYIHYYEDYYKLLHSNLYN